MSGSYISHKMGEFYRTRDQNSTLLPTDGVLDFFRDPAQSIVNIFVGKKATAADVRAMAEKLLLKQFPATISNKSANRLLYLAAKANRAFLEKLDSEYDFFQKTRSKIFGAENVVAERWLDIKREYTRDLRNLSLLRQAEQAGNFDGVYWKRHLLRYWQGLARAFETVDDMVDAQYFGQDWARVAFEAYDAIEETLVAFVENLKAGAQATGKALKYATYAGIGLGAFYLYKQVMK